jgi:hypothetical protein
MVKPAHLRDCSNPPCVWWLDRARLWRVLLQAYVRATPMIIVCEVSEVAIQARVSLAGITRHPDQAWMQQMARNATGETWGFLEQRRYALHDRDMKFCSLFGATLAAGGIKPIQLRGVQT